MTTNTHDLLETLTDAARQMDIAIEEYAEAVQEFMRQTEQRPLGHHPELERTAYRLTRDAADLRKMTEALRAATARHECGEEV